jgi:hypothetical protein
LNSADAVENANVNGVGVYVTLHVNVNVNVNVILTLHVTVTVVLDGFVLSAHGSGFQGARGRVQNPTGGVEFRT